jgi:hypothetical protein
MTKTYTIILADHDIENLVYPAFDNSAQPLGYQAKTLIEAQVIAQDAAIATAQDAEASVSESENAAVIDGEVQAAPDVAT